MRYVSSLFLAVVFASSLLISPAARAATSESCTCYDSDGAEHETTTANGCNAECAEFGSDFSFTGEVTDGVCECEGATSFASSGPPSCETACEASGWSTTNYAATGECILDEDCPAGQVCSQYASGEHYCANDSSSTAATPVNTEGVDLVNPLATNDIRVIIGTLIKAALGLSGSIALLMFILGGFLWLTAGGNAEKIEKGKQVLIWATIGLIVIFFAYTIVNAVISALTTGSVG